MVARGGWLKVCCPPSRSVGGIELTFEKKKARQAGPCLISKRIAFNRLSRQLFSFIELAEINHHARQEIVRSRVPWRELLRTTEFVHTLSKFPLDKKPDPAERSVRFRKLWLD